MINQQNIFTGKESGDHSAELISQYEVFVSSLFQKNGPDPEDDIQILEIIGQITSGQIDYIRRLMMPILNPETIIGFSYTKPFGYNGDFFIIEKIYQHFVSTHPYYRKWDEFFHRLPAAIAVVNRKKLAVEILTKLSRKRREEQTSVLILGSGPVTEVNEFLSAAPNPYMHFDLVDLDKRAIAYAKSKNRLFLNQLNFINQNVIRYEPDRHFDLIWSAGLFDYFRDKHFVYLLKKFYQLVKPGGEMIIGNFNVENPSRKIMEVLGDWFLYHRSADDLLSFAMQSGIPFENISVVAEPLGINLFLRLTKS
ncbi:MAG TPA: class I SAM-dependent methyltransferase [Bacteroidales bacterium]|nr:class I SAM-dependent methyltransferase [Bacteroidales bacterium]HPR57454.1 class I SAM-dependent methyltransferase [Bacteroidales bacterium]HRW96333.1 class I SAM-dependent methyltransferase [Bacteroidales bacterium]